MKTMTDNDQLLEEYLRNGSETAFRELVSRYINFVYSTALRLMNGDRQAAEDVTQTVFVRLAQNARKISTGAIGGWLHRDACFVASKMRRTEERRRAREQEAAFMNAPEGNEEFRIEQLGSELEEAINELGEDDRQAILLRFYEQRDFRTVGTALGTSEDAARMRVGRALNKLQVLLGRRGVALSGSALGTVLLSGAASAAPAGLAATVSTAALTSAATIGNVCLMGTLVMAKTKLLVGVPVLIAGATSVMLWQSHYETNELRNRLVDQNRRIEELTSQNSSLQTKAPIESVATDADRELLKLRGEVNVLKKQLAEASTIKEQLPDRAVPLSENEQRYMADMLREQYLSRLKMQHTRQWVMGLHMYAVENGGRMPEKLDQVKLYIGAAETNENDNALLLATNELSLVWRGSLTEARQKDAIVLMTAPSMKVPGDPSSGWVKIYGMADGRVERAESQDGDFSKWEEGRVSQE